MCGLGLALRNREVRSAQPPPVTNRGAEITSLKERDKNAK